MTIRRARGIGRILRTVPVLLLTSCAVNPATGAREFSLIGEGREIEMGRESDAQVTAAYGLVDDAELQGLHQVVAAAPAAHDRTNRLGPSQRQRKGAADQPHAHNTHSFKHVGDSAVMNFGQRLEKSVVL